MPIDSVAGIGAKRGSRLQFVGLSGSGVLGFARLSIVGVWVLGMGMDGIAWLLKKEIARILPWCGYGGEDLVGSWQESRRYAIFKVSWKRQIRPSFP